MFQQTGLDKHGLLVWEKHASQQNNKISMWWWGVNKHSHKGLHWVCFHAYSGGADAFLVGAYSVLQSQSQTICEEWALKLTDLYVS